jgi:hypothetical protein
MGAVQQAIPSAVPSAVDPANTVAVNQKAQRNPYQPMTGSSNVPHVPGNEDNAETPWQPSYATVGRVGQTLVDGSTGAPSVPSQDTALFKRGPIDAHYTVPSERNVYKKVNNPPTRGRVSWIKSYANHVFNGRQNVDSAGWQQNSAQQRTSYLRVTLPPHGDGYSPATSAPVQLPQAPRTYRFNPTTGNDQPGVVPGQGTILNTSTYGAGQTAGGLGGNQYTPAASPPGTTPVTPQDSTGMPSWG